MSDAGTISITARTLDLAREALESASAASPALTTGENDD